MKTLNEIADAVYDNAIKHGFHKNTIKEWWPAALLNMIGEISEAWDADRSGKAFELCDKAKAMKKLGLKPLTCLEEEYADLIIRALDNSRRLKIDILRAIQTKHAYNKTRPYMHGKRN